MILEILNSFYNFFHLRGSAFQSYVGYLNENDFTMVYAAIQFMIINKVGELLFTRHMYTMKSLKKLYIVCNIVFAALLMSGMMTSNVITLLAMDMLIVVIYTVNSTVSMTKVEDLYLMSHLNKKRGISNLITFAIGMLVAAFLKYNADKVMIVLFLLLHILTTVVVLKKWNFVPEEASEKKRKKYEYEPQALAYMVSGVFMSISSVFDLYYVEQTLKNGYSLASIATLASIGALISGVGFIAASAKYFEMDKIKKYILMTRLLLGIFPFLVLLNLPGYPILKVIVFGLDGFLVSTYQSLFLASRDRRSLAFMSSLRATIGYATFSVAVMFVSKGLINMWVLAIICLVMNIVASILLYKLKEQGFHFLNLKEKMLKKYSPVGKPVVLMHQFINTKSKIGDIGIVKKMEDSKLYVDMDNGEYLSAGLHAFGMFGNVTIRQLIFSYQHLNVGVSRIKYRDKIYKNVDMIYGLIDPDVTVVLSHRFMSDGTLEIQKVNNGLIA